MTTTSSPPADASPSQALITLLQLGRRAREAERLETLGFVIVNESLQLLPYRQAVLWMPSASTLTASGRVRAVSGVPQIEENAPYIQWLDRLGQYCVQRLTQSGTSALTPGNSANHPTENASQHVSTSSAPSPDQTPKGFPRLLTAHDLPEHLAEELSNWMPAYILWLPLWANNQFEGSLFLAREEPWQSHEYTLLAELGHNYAHALAAFAPRKHWRERWKARLKPGKTFAGAAAALLLLSLIQVRLSVVAPAEVMPQHPFLVRAPLDGVIDRFQIQPNQMVKAGTVLFNLEPTTIQSRFELAQKAYDTATEEYRQAAQLAVTDDKSRLEIAIAKGKLDERQVELSYSSEQLGRLQVKAARDGVAVFSDVNQWQGKAVTVGERILMLADPADVELVVFLPAADSIALEKGAEVTLYPNASPTLSYRAQLQHIAYRAEPTPEGVLAYRVKAHFTPGQNLPRIGQMGTATLYGERVPLIYYILRRPFTAARQWLGW